MRIRDRFKMLAKGREVFKTFQAIGKSEATMGRMSLIEFVKAIKKNPTGTIAQLSDEEFLTFFEDEKNRETLFKAIPTLRDAYEIEREHRKL